MSKAAGNKDKAKPADNKDKAKPADDKDKADDNKDKADKVPVFSSFSKPTNDFFTKGFPASHKLEVSTSTENGLTFISSGEHKTKKDGGGDYVLGKLETKYKQAKYGLEFSGSIDTDNLIKGDLSVNNIGLPGFKAILKPQTGKTKEVTSAFEFQHQRASLATTLLWKPEGDLQLTAALVGGHKGFALGLESGYFVSRAHPEKLPVGLDSVKGLFNFKTPALDFTLTAKQQWNVEPKKDDSASKAPLTQKLILGSTYEHKAGDSTVLHSALEYDTTQPLSESVTFKFGGLYKLDKDTTAQGKFDTEGKLTVNLAKQFNPQLKASLTTEFDTLALARGQGHEQKLALGVTFKA